MNLRIFLAGTLTALAFLSCTKSEPTSATDPLPLPPGMAENKDLSVLPGDSFYDYCNGSWLKKTPIPASGSVGGLYEQNSAMEERVKNLKASVPDLGRFYELRDAASGQPELTQTWLDAQRTLFPAPQTKEEAFITMGKMLANGFPMWGNPLMPAWNMAWRDGRLYGVVAPYLENIPLPDVPTELDPSLLVPLTQTKAGGSGSPASLIIKGMGLDPSLFFVDPGLGVFWELMEAMSLEKLNEIIDSCWAFYEKFGAEALTKDVRESADFANAYTLSYHFSQVYLSPEFKEKYLGITREIQASLRKRIQNVEWMSETTRQNALEKLDYCGLNVAYPDQWYTECVAQYADCATLAEAVFRGNQGIGRLKAHLLGGTDLFSHMITTCMLGTDSLIPSDLTLLNAMYAPAFNSVFIYPALLLPPILPENVSAAYEYAIFMFIGHEFTHGFDSIGSQYDKYGRQRNWWTVADKMSFEERRDLLVQCYDHLEIDPVRAPGVFSDGTKAQTENIADLGGLLAALDAYKAYLEDKGFTGETYKEQLRKFFECYGEVWRVQYSDTKLSTFPKKDEHSHARLRVNGVVMNTDLWYELFDVTRNNILYLPKERRTYIW